jgi:hypothetical protein
MPSLFWIQAEGVNLISWKKRKYSVVYLREVLKLSDGVIHVYSHIVCVYIETEIEKERNRDTDKVRLQLT